jgi:diguanylate cyclase (GGDEF)-like protein
MNNVEDVVRPLLMSGFGGFFCALGAVSVIAAGLMRSVASAAYAALMGVMAAIEFLNVGTTFYGGEVLHGIFVALFLCAQVGFTFSLLRTWDYDRAIAWTTIGVLSVNVPLIFAEELMPWWKSGNSYLLDQLALDALLLMLVACGLKALAHEERPIAVVFLAALVGPLIGIVLNDLSTNHRLPHTILLTRTFELGMIWQAMFFAYAVALRNRGIQLERDRFERLAYLDGLTGVANRRTFDETLQRMWAVARRGRVPFAIIIIDIDHFKRLNDTRGHQVGDECLRRVAALCSSMLRRAGDLFARYGGEEFAAILVNLDADRAMSLAESMRRAVESDGGITISVGIASRVPGDADDPLALVADADDALYRAKNAGRNCVRMAQGSPERCST